MISLNSDLIVPYIFDLELSGRCNTVCTFCPREEMKRGEQLMSAENFEHFLGHLKEYVEFLEGRRLVLEEEKAGFVAEGREKSPVRVLLCGMGESLIHPQCAQWVGRIRREVGVRLSIVTNGLMLKDAMVDNLIEAGVTVLFVSVPGIDEASYTRYVPLPWERVLGNIERAAAKMPGRVQINVPIPDDAPFNAEQATEFWKSKGIPIASITHCHNRGGFLNNVTLTGRFGVSGSHFCGILGRHNFIAWDGRVLSCCHDLHAENVVGHVVEDSFVEICRRKTPMMEGGPSYRICGTCNDCERLERGQLLRLRTSERACASPGVSVMKGGA